MSFNIETVAERRRLKVSREPYFARLDAGTYVGVRILPDLMQTWVARYRTPHQKKQNYRALGTLSEVPAAERYSHAKKLAEAFANEIKGGGTGKRVTVRDVVLNYIEDRREAKGDACADENLRALTKHVLSHEIAAMPAHALTPAILKNWRRGLLKKGDAETVRRSKNSANRTWNRFKAALRRGVKDKMIASDAAWRDIEIYPEVNARRSIYLTQAQRTALLHAAPDDLRAFLRGLLLTTFRVGELGRLNVEHFNDELGTVHINGTKKVKPRDVTLSTEAATLFREQCRDKLPSAPLFMQASGRGWRTANDWGDRIRAAVERAGLPKGVVAYTLRHTSISAHIEAGLDLLTASRVAGTSIKMIQEHYGHLERNATREKLDQYKVAC